MDTIQDTFQKIPGVSNTEASDVAKKLNRLDKIATMIDENKLATKEDIARTQADIAESRAATQADIAELRVATKEDIAEFKAETKEDIAATQADIAEFKTETKVEIEKTKTEIRTGLADLKTDLTWRMVLLFGVAAGVTGAIIKIM